MELQMKPATRIRATACLPGAHRGPARCSLPAQPQHGGLRSGTGAPTLESFLSQATQAQADGQREKARGLYRDAAKAYPTDKTPWLKLAEDYFAAGDYGNAVLAGQEVLERDPQDTTANSLLAVSGLRITAGSLKALRKDAEYPVGSREEALAVTRSLRETLGETALLPIVPPGARPKQRRRPAPRQPPSAGHALRTPRPAAAAARGNPLDKLK
jgi:tetratricopeptide (TPR) repeat protein